METYYRHKITGDISAIHGDLMEPISLYLDGVAYLTDRVFAGCFTDAELGDNYISEWAQNARDNDGEEYRIVWEFDQVKGEEVEPDELPWEDRPNISKIIAL